MKKTPKTPRLSRTAKLAKAVRRTLATAAFASILFGAGAFCRAADWTYGKSFDPDPITGKIAYDNIVQFGSNTTLQIAVSGDQIVTFGKSGNTVVSPIPFSIYTDDFDSPLIDRCTLDVNLTGKGTIRFGSNGGSGLAGGKDRWKFIDNHHLTTGENIHFVLGGDGGDGGGQKSPGGAGGAGTLRLNNSAGDPVRTTFDGTLTLGGKGGNNTADEHGDGSAGGLGGVGTLEVSGASALQVKGALSLGGGLG